LGRYIIPQWYEWIVIAMYILTFIIGVSGNILVCFAVWRNRQMRTVTNMFIVNLSAETPIINVSMYIAITIHSYHCGIIYLPKFLRTSSSPLHSPSSKMQKQIVLLYVYLQRYLLTSQKRGLWDMLCVNWYISLW
jgi:hypothetical protein